MRTFFTTNTISGDLPPGGGSVGNTRLLVANISNPTELANYNAFQSGTSIIAYTADGINYTIYCWTNNILTEDSPNIVLGLTGSWVAIAGTLYKGAGGSRAFSFFEG